MTATAYKEPPAFLAFCAKYGDGAAVELLTRICEAQYNDGKGPGVCMDIYQHDACNHTLSGRIEHDGEEFDFIIDNGNWGGTVVKEFGGPDDVGIYEPPAPPRYTMVPIKGIENLTPLQRKVYELWKKDAWFAELVGKYAYDRHFAPGSATETYWQAQAAKRGLRLVTIHDD